MKIACAALSGLASILCGGAPAYAHDWYPFECCAQNDCMPAGAVEVDGRGAMTVIVGDRRIEIPADFTLRLSPDSRTHVCFRLYPNEIDGSIIVTPVCLFRPAQV
jgi:hypothetical protein